MLCMVRLLLFKCRFVLLSVMFIVDRFILCVLSIWLLVMCVFSMWFIVLFSCILVLLYRSMLLVMCSVLVSKVLGVVLLLVLSVCMLLVVSSRFFDRFVLSISLFSVMVGVWKLLLLKIVRVSLCRVRFSVVCMLMVGVWFSENMVSLLMVMVMLCLMMKVEFGVVIIVVGFWLVMCSECVLLMCIGLVSMYWLVCR